MRLLLSLESEDLKGSNRPRCRRSQTAAMGSPGKLHTFDLCKVVDVASPE